VSAIHRTPEPSTEPEAQRLKRFLQLGASTTLEPIESFEAPESATVVLGEPATFSFGVTGQDALSLAQATNRRVVLAIDVSDVVRDNDFFVHVFVNDDLATADTPPTDPHFVGGFAFFCRVQDSTGRLVCIPANTSLQYRLDLEPALRRIQNVGESLRVRVVLVPFPERTPETRTIGVTKAAVNILRSEVKPAS
jgi:hypothetical protein